MHYRALFISALILISSFSAQAHPVAFKGAVGVMEWNQWFMTDDWVTYSFRSDAAIAARHMRFEVQGGRMQYFAPQLDYLVHRWNERDLQANIYAYGSLGVLNFQNLSQGAGLGGVEADAETRTYFAMAKYEKMWGTLGPDFYQGVVRVGVAPYEAEFTEIASWFMIQYQWHPMLLKQDAVTPLIRLFYKSVLFETGVSFDGDWMMNFMFHF